MNMQCILDGPLAPGTLHQASHLAFANTQQHPHIQGGGLHHMSSILGSIGSPGERSDEFETGVQEFSASTNEGFGDFNVSTLDQMAFGGQGKSLRGTERAKLACVACRRDNKKASPHDLEGTRHP